MKHLLLLIALTISLTAISDTTRVKKDTVKCTDTSLVSPQAKALIRNEVKQNVLGGLSVGFYLSAFLFSFIGLFLRWYWTVRTGIKNNPESPNTFSWKYWVENNLIPKMLSVISTFFILYIGLRFSVDLFGVEASMFFAFAIGICFDFLVSKINSIKLTK